ncbi:NXPE family member 3-like [Branchiostoma floridae x Branchiostoma belcheri]
MGKHLVISVVNPKRVFYVGDTLSVKIVAKDAEGRPKLYGGDFLRAKLFSKVPVNASTAGRITDYGNGTYVARFFLSWPGNLSVSVQMIHSSEAVQVLRKIRDNIRRIMVCSFHDESGNMTEWMPCSNTANRSMNLRDVCDFSKPFINSTFYCQRPQLSRCDSITDCHRGEKETLALQNHLANLDERKLFSRDTEGEQLPVINMIQVNGRRVSSRSNEKLLPLCAPGLPETPSEGYWFNGTWYSLKCRARTFPTSHSVLRCLKNKSVFFYGDSTTKQLWKFLAEFLNLETTGSVIYHTAAVNQEFNTKLEFTFQHFPRNVRDKEKKWLHFRSLHYVAEEIDEIIGGPNVVVVLGLWGHYTAEPIKTFRSRLYGIRYAIERLHSRYPETKVIWRTSNTRQQNQLSHFLENSDWYAYQLLTEVKKIMQGLNIAIMDVWEMTSCMWHDPIMHVPKDIVRNMVDLILSYICPY